MYHHDKRNYEEAVSDAAKKMRIKLQENIHSAQAKSVAALQRIENEIPEDHVVASRRLDFVPAGAGRELALSYPVAAGEAIEGSKLVQVHNWALGQVCEAVGLKRDYVKALLGRGDEKDPWGAELAAHNLNELYGHHDESHLLRSYGGVLRGFLSPRYKRRHPGRILDVLIQGFKHHGLIAYDAWCSDTRHGVRAVLDRIVEPVPNECLGIGVYYSESPYGNGATSLSIFAERMWCTNLAVMEQSLREVHLGGRLSEDVSWSDDTYRKDTDLMSSQLTDMLEGTISEKAIEKLCRVVKAAHAQKLDAKGFADFLKKHLSAGDASSVLAAYNTADVEMLPAGNNVWRASNAISFFAGTVNDEEKKLDLQRLAGKILPTVK